VSLAAGGNEEVGSQNYPPARSVTALGDHHQATGMTDMTVRHQNVNANSDRMLVVPERSTPKTPARGYGLSPMKRLTMKTNATLAAKIPTPT